MVDVRGRPATGKVKASEDLEGPWKLLERSPGASVRRAAETYLAASGNAAARKQHQEAQCKREAAALERDSDRVVYRYSRTGEQVVLEREQSGWRLLWGGERHDVTLLGFERVRTNDGKEWIVQAPDTTPEGTRLVQAPREARDGGLAPMLRGWYEAMSLYADPSLVAERPRAVKVAQVLTALREAVERRGPRSEKLMTALEEVARAYLKALQVPRHPDPKSQRAKQGHKLIPERSAAVESLAAWWLGHLPPRYKTGTKAQGVAEQFMRNLRDESFNWEIAVDLPNLLAADVAERQAIVRKYEDICDAIFGRRRDLLCAKCEPGTGALGKDGNYWTSPVPGDTRRWGCLKGAECLRGLEKLSEEMNAASRRMLYKALIILGYPRSKARSLFDYERVQKERKAGKRLPRRTPRRRSA